MKKIFPAFLFIFTLSSCSFLQNFQKQQLQVDSLDKGAKMDMRKFFVGDLEGFGIVQDQNGKITDTLAITINGKWEENKGVVQQNFIHTDGKKDSRTWLITLANDGGFTAVGHDIVAPAQGKQTGNALQMIYSLLLPGEMGKQQIAFDDKIYLIDEKSAIMISDSKKGFSGSGKSIISLKKLVNGKE
ncbi:MAG: hypothetical protein A2887_06855 [Alphaproteobacteria bacterium RIFCSPLOWO2_01_FULL_40_26]|nr:MAG: hypothetical protein A3D15_02725 [Alphaproteobacteria bacterium RIFCSPHIGHO2_02_FULL_40_34]OFW95553.1 MAG: hypothetical protein A2887_06855 [Alphaproteobacteria bacterium RIFCSPLOWO2_01_FULL_40_26]OFX09605.1 MAG: hypothetical protein A3H30_01370 [Alphaproteobacteria bacterium RIFCSPLOWO2_02_FULL_40_19]OFX12289.1 MAG: hypothetical protein A3G22_06315 [Alphaproteobacteria bacterium RIFCSPLOWO2_12_FULL_40_11]